MLTKDFYFDLPENLIAQHPSGIRGQDKLMLLNRQKNSVEHFFMDDLPNLIPENTLMIFNNSKVRRSRVYGIKNTTGRETEFLFVNPLSIEDSNISQECLSKKIVSVWKTMVKSAKKQHPGNIYRFPDGSEGVILDNPMDKGSEFRTLAFNFQIDEDWFLRNGHIPLPPYIRREDTEEDSERYQNIYASETGSSACPTAGLHFTQEMLNKLDAKGIQRSYVTLHVGLGTFLPVRAENIKDHVMHTESYSISEETAKLVTEAKKTGRPILAVGTTSVRTLEAAWDKVNNCLPAGIGSTNIFMYPGYKFQVVDKMFTNFHTPESTLLMLVSAFAGKDTILNAYKIAVENKYRFFSYGDAMLIL